MAAVLKVGTRGRGTTAVLLRREQRIEWRSRKLKNQKKVKTPFRSRPGHPLSSFLIFFSFFVTEFRIELLVAQ
jgi:hypothetical protein